MWKSKRRMLNRNQKYKFGEVGSSNKEHLNVIE